MSASSASFYFDLQSPAAYLVSERVLHALPEPAEWQPVLARELDGGEEGVAFRCAEERDVWRLQLERRARELGLQPLRWPEPFPFDSTLAMRVATYAKSIGRVVPFAQADFRQDFAGARDLGRLDNVLIAAAACEMHPTAVTRGAELRSVEEQLAAATNGARKTGINQIPALVIDGEVFEGEQLVELAARRMR